MGASSAYREGHFPIRGESDPGKNEAEKCLYGAKPGWVQPMGGFDSRDTATTAQQAQKGIKMVAQEIQTSHSRAWDALVNALSGHPARPVEIESTPICTHYMFENPMGSDDDEDERAY